MSKLTPGWQRTSVLESVFDQLSDALVLYDPEYRITGVNRAAEKLFGMTSEEMLGGGFCEVAGNILPSGQIANRVIRAQHQIPQFTPPRLFIEMRHNQVGNR